MIYYEKDTDKLTIYKDTDNLTIYRVDKIGGHYYGWAEGEVFEGSCYTTHPNQDEFTQRFLGPRCMGFWE